MLRITVHNEPESITFQLEGRLSRPWLQELDKCWRRTLISKDSPSRPRRPDWLNLRG